MGLLTTARGVDKAREQVEDAVRHGARVAYQGKLPSGEKFEKGHFFPSTIFRNMNSSMRITHEESFAPIAAVYKFKT
jgi:succinate-semialdehyde dehydrogenase